MAGAEGGVCDTGPVTQPESESGPPPGSPSAPPSALPSSSADGVSDGASGSASHTASHSASDSASDGASGSVTDGAPETPPNPPPHTPWRTALLIAIALAVVAVDIVTKALVAANIALGENIRILGGAVYLTQIRNAGAAFNMATGMTWLLAIIAVAVVVFIIRMAPKLRSTPWAVCLGLILGGALGNLIDRIFRAPGVMQGHVVDFVSLFGPDAKYFPAFNAADSAISIGGVLLVLLAITGFDFDGTRHRGRRGRDG